MKMKAIVKINVFMLYKDFCFIVSKLDHDYRLETYRKQCLFFILRLSIITVSTIIL